MTLPSDLHLPLALSGTHCGAEAMLSANGEWLLFEGFHAVGDDDACQQIDGRPALVEGRVLACLSDRARVERIRGEAAAAVSAGVRGLILDKPDGWWVAGPQAAAFCARCRDSLGAHLVAGYGAHFIGFDPAAVIGAAISAEASAALERVPYGRDREVWRLSRAVDAIGNVVRRARDQSRLENRPVAVGARFQAVTPAALQAARFFDLCLYPAPAPRGVGQTGTGLHELVRAAMGRRPASAVVLGAAALPVDELASAAGLCAALGVDLCPDGPLSEEACAALTAFRTWQKDLRSEDRPHERVAEVSVLYSVESDLWSGGRHRAALLAVAEALTAAGVQYAIRLDLARWGTEPLVLCAAQHLIEGDARRIRRKVEGGGSAVVVGALGAVDEDGRAAPPPFPEPKPGLSRKGDGDLYAIAPGAAALPAHEALLSELSRGLGVALGRGRRAVTVGGTAKVVARAYLDPTRKLDVHLTNLGPGPLANLSVQIAGNIAGAGRKAMLFRPGREPEKLTLTPQGFGVVGVVPQIERYAVITVPR